MYSGNGPPSFSSPGMNIYNQEEQLQNNQQWPNNDIQAPSYTGVAHGQGNSYNQLHDTTAYRGLTQETETNGEKKAPSFTGVGRGQTNSHTHDGNLSREPGGVGNDQAPSFGSLTRENVSHPSGSADPYSSDQAPSRNAVNGRGPSYPGGSSSMVIEGDDVQEFVGMSLVGKNFRKFYPNAYYKEKDGDN